MTWRYNIVRFPDHFGLHEVYFDEEGRPNGMTENSIISVDLEEGVEGIKSSLALMVDCAEKYEPMEARMILIDNKSAPSEPTGPSIEAKAETYDDMRKISDMLGYEDLLDALENTPKKTQK